MRHKASPARPLIVIGLGANLPSPAYGDKVTRGETLPLLPHPRMHERAFVLLPLQEVAPRWYHPFLGRTLDQLIDKLPRGQTARPIA